MKAYDSFDHYTPKDWVRNKNWIINRSLFLLWLKEKNNELFFGCSYWPEYMDMERINNDEFLQAVDVWFNTNNNNPPYCEVT
jgi:hypothetical protein